MDTIKLRNLLKETNSSLRTQPYNLLSMKGRNYINLENTTKSDLLNQQAFASLRCHTCTDTRRQNYQLKQQLSEYSQKDDKIYLLENELSAVRQLYELKCQETELIKNELNSYKQKMEFVQSRSKRFCQNAASNISKQLKQIDNTATFSF